MPDYVIDLTGTKEEIQEMLNVASKVEPGCYKKQWINDGKCRVWYRGDNVGQPNDLVSAIRKKANISKPTMKKKEEA